MDKFFFTFLLILIIEAVCTESLNDLLPYQSDQQDDSNKNLKLKITLDTVRLKISDSLYLECPIGRLKPPTFMFLRKNAVDFMTRFSIQLNDTFQSNKKKKRKEEDLATFLNSNWSSSNEDSSPVVEESKDKLLLHCKWLSSDLDQEFGNFTLHLIKPKDNVQLNNHLFKYFDSKLDHSQDVPKIISSSNRVFKRKLGDKVSFFCNVNRPSNVKVTWYRKDENSFINLNDEMRTNKHALDIVNYRLTSNKLTIKEISENDLAEYICRASNDYGEDYVFYKLELTTSKQFIPPLIASFEDVNLNENKSIVLNCSITSYEKFSVQWFENMDCKRQDCKSEEFVFIDNKIYYKPMLSTNSELISHNGVQYTATYPLNKVDLMKERKYVCMVRNQNGLNYKIMTLRVNDRSPTISLLTSSSNNNDEMTTILIVLFVAVLFLFIVLVVIIVIIRRRSRKRRNDNLKEVSDNFLNNNATTSRSRSQNDYINAMPSHSNRNKDLNNDKWKKSSNYMINNLIQTGRSLNTQGDFSQQFINKHNRSKMSSLSNSFTNVHQRINNTPIQDDSYIFQNI